MDSHIIYLKGAMTSLTLSFLSVGTSTLLQLTAFLWILVPSFCVRWDIFSTGCIDEYAQKNTTPERAEKWWILCGSEDTLAPPPMLWTQRWTICPRHSDPKSQTLHGDNYSQVSEHFDEQENLPTPRLATVWFNPLEVNLSLYFQRSESWRNNN